MATSLIGNIVEVYNKFCNHFHCATLQDPYQSDHQQLEGHHSDDDAEIQSRLLEAHSQQQELDNTENEDGEDHHVKFERYEAASDNSQQSQNQGTEVKGESDHEEGRHRSRSRSRRKSKKSRRQRRRSSSSSSAGRYCKSLEDKYMFCFGFYLHKVNLLASFQIVSQPPSFDSFHLTQTSPKVGHEGHADQDGQVLTKDRPLNTAALCRDKKV